MRATSLVAASAVTAAVHAGSLKDIKHIVLFMQENRAFDHVGYLQLIHVLLGIARSDQSDGSPCSTLAPWLVCEGLVTPMSRSTPTESRFLSSNYETRIAKGILTNEETLRLGHSARRRTVPIS